MSSQLNLIGKQFQVVQYFESSNSMGSYVVRVGFSNCLQKQGNIQLSMTFQSDHLVP